MSLKAVSRLSIPTVALSLNCGNLSPTVSMVSLLCEMNGNCGKWRAGRPLRTKIGPPFPSFKSIVRIASIADINGRADEPPRPPISGCAGRTQAFRPRRRSELRQPADALDADPQARGRARRRTRRAHAAQGAAHRGRPRDRAARARGAERSRADPPDRATHEGSGIGHRAPRHFPDARAVPFAARDSAHP